MKMLEKALKQEQIQKRVQDQGFLLQEEDLMGPKEDQIQDQVRMFLLSQSKNQGQTQEFCKIQVERKRRESEELPLQVLFLILQISTQFHLLTQRSDTSIIRKENSLTMKTMLGDNQIILNRIVSQMRARKLVKRRGQNLRQHRAGSQSLIDLERSKQVWEYLMNSSRQTMGMMDGMTLCQKVTKMRSKDKRGKEGRDQMMRRTDLNCPLSSM
mmetsp:Transcript_41280/g.57498  ORF Transcript_41280/g.57498 Transcript_41280/m.57498 type:complete len:213 (-) Transcript_41280:803-1441(-)